MLSVPAAFSLKTAYVLASLLSCSPQPPPPVTLEFHNNTPQIDNTKSMDEMRALRKASTSPEYNGEFPNVEGIMSGPFQIAYDLEFERTTRPLLRSACVNVKSLHIDLTYSPVIHISPKDAPGSCRYREALAHEMRHVQTDVATLSEYIPDIKKITAASLAVSVTGKPVGINDADQTQAGIDSYLSKTLDGTTKAIQQTRIARQQAVDTHEEYERLSRACPEETQ